MGGNGGAHGGETIVTTKEELKAAMDRKEKTIIVVGNLAHKIRQTDRLKTYGPIGFAILAAAVAVIPLSGGTALPVEAGIVSFAVPGGASAGTALLSAVIFLGLALLYALYEDYDAEVAADGVATWKDGQPRVSGSFSMKLNRKR